MRGHACILITLSKLARSAHKRLNRPRKSLIVLAHAKVCLIALSASGPSNAMADHIASAGRMIEYQVAAAWPIPMHYPALSFITPRIDE